MRRLLRREVGRLRDRCQPRQRHLLAPPAAIHRHRRVEALAARIWEHGAEHEPPLSLAGTRERAESYDLAVDLGDHHPLGRDP